MKRKVIIFDLFSAQPKAEIKFHGGGEYIKTVFYRISQYAATADIHVCYDTEVFIDQWILNRIKERKITVHSVKSEKEIVKEIDRIEDSDAKVCFYTGMIYLYRSDQVKFPDRVRTIGTCHGLRTLEKPYEKYGYIYGTKKQYIKEFLRKTICRNMLHKKYYTEFKNSLENFDVVITVSEHSAYALKVHFPSIVEKIDIRVLYTPMKIAEIKYEPSDGKFIMMISADRWLKNAYRGVLAIDKLLEKGYLKEYKVKVYGNYPETLRKKVKNRDNFEFYGYVDNDELERAYANCSVFFYPTLNEGFGLPPMEAMKYAKTCVISAVCSLPEVYGDAVYYCNPYDLQEIQNRLLQAVEKRIEEEKIYNRLSYVQKRQNDDLTSLCSLILGETDNG